MLSSKCKNKKSISIETAKLSLIKFALKYFTNTVCYNFNRKYCNTFGVNFWDILVETQKGLQVQNKQEKRNQAPAFQIKMEMLKNENALERCSI